MYKLNSEKMFFDMADDQAIVINSITGVYFAMNMLGSKTFDYLIKGVNPEQIVSTLKQLPECPGDISKQLDIFIQYILDKELAINSDKPFANEEVVFEQKILDDGFCFDINEFSEAADLILADPIHDVDVELGWPTLKEDK